MPRLKHLLIGSAVTALAVTAIGVPAASAAGPSALTQPSVRFINGLPGTKLTVCVDDIRIKAKLRYGRSVGVLLSADSHKFKFRKPKNGTCNGKVVGKQTLDALPGANIALVASIVGGRPGVRVFDDNLIPVAAGPANSEPTGTFHHAARAPKVDVYRSTQLISTPPSAWKGLARGKSAVLPAAGGATWQAWLTKAGKQKVLAGPAYRMMTGGHNIYVFVGTKLKNYRLVMYVPGQFN